MAPVTDAEDNARAELAETRKAAGEMFLAGHLEKHEMEQKAVTTALQAEIQRDEDHRIAHKAAHDAHERIHRIEAEGHLERHSAESRAVTAAQSAMDARLVSMNEFRDQLRDQASTFIRREQLETFISQYERAHDDVVIAIAAEREERRKNDSDHALIHRGEEGQKRGISQSTAFIVSTIGVVGALITIVIVVANFVSAQP